MPKAKVTTVDEDAPIWDEVLAELGDPRPYDPPEFLESYREPDDPWVDPDYFDDLVYELHVQAEDAASALDGWGEQATEALDKIWSWPPHVIELRNMTETTTQFAVVGALPTES